MTTLAQLVDEFLETEFGHSPTLASNLGLTQYDHLLDDLSGRPADLRPVRVRVVRHPLLVEVDEVLGHASSCDGSRTALAAALYLTTNGRARIRHRVRRSLVGAGTGGRQVRRSPGTSRPCSRGSGSRTGSSPGTAGSDPRRSCGRRALVGDLVADLDLAPSVFASY